MLQEFKRTRYAVLIIGVGTTVMFVLVWPIIMSSLLIITDVQFQHWINLTDTWAFTAAVFIITVPLVTEVKDIIQQFQHKRARVRVAPTTTGSAESRIAEERA